MGRVVTQTRGQTLQTLNQAFDFVLRLQKLSRVFEKFFRVFEKLNQVFEKLIQAFE